MGTYYKVLNVDRKEFLEPAAIADSINPKGCAIKAGPMIFGPIGHIVMHALIYGRWAPTNQNTSDNLWTGCSRIIVVGDWCDVYDVGDNEWINEDLKGWTNVSKELIEDFAKSMHNENIVHTPISWIDWEKEV